MGPEKSPGGSGFAQGAVKDLRSLNVGGLEGGAITKKGGGGEKVEKKNLAGTTI